MGTTTDSTAAVQHATEKADYDVVAANGEHHIEHGLAAVARALSDGAKYAVEVGIRDGVYAEERSWAEALVREHRAAGGGF